jgi:hypothetical protein
VDLQAGVRRVRSFDRSPQVLLSALTSALLVFARTFLVYQKAGWWQWIASVVGLALSSG